MGEFAVELRDVTKRFPNPGGGEVVAVDHITMEVPHGKFYSLLGPSGCGKTTSLRMIAGFEWPTSGEVYIDGNAIGRTPPFLRPVNTVFQSFALFQHMSVFQNVAFGLEMEKTSKPEIERRVNEALDMVQLSGMGKRKPKQLSGGQQQRVALARALIKRPAVLLLDEPLGALDLKLRKEMQLELKALQVQVGITFIYVTHDQEEALTMSDQIAVMNKGKALQIGSPVEIYERPNCRFVADFIGDTNILSGVIKEFDSSLVVVNVPVLGTDILGIRNTDLVVGQKVAVSVRPEKIRITDGSKFYPNTFPAEVVSMAYIGSDTRLVVHVAQDLRMKVWEKNEVSTLDLSSYFPGQKIWLTFIPENTMILPEE
jgi:spermidine/putrescine transport system ATP-binding protein